MDNLENKDLQRDAEPVTEPETAPETEPVTEPAAPAPESAAATDELSAAASEPVGTSAPQPERKVQYYSAANKPPKKKMPGWAKALIIIGVIVLCLALVGAGFKGLLSDLTSSLTGTQHSSDVTTDFGYDYIGTIYVEGEMSEDYAGTYDHEYILNSIDAMIDDPENKGMILFVDTPGGTVFSADELYFKIKEYQEETGRPVYSSMQSMAASGGYYISAPVDKIIANRNCWTGSIGVTMGTFLDVSQLLENLGIRTESITSGANKGMGSSYEPMTAEQKAIYQSLIDEAYDQFVGIVAEGRGMDDAAVRKVADGRIYTAKQAMELGLVDAIGTYEEAVADMKTTYELGDCEVEEFYTTASTDIFSLLGEAAGNGATDADMIEELLALDGKFQLSYISEVRK